MVFEIVDGHLSHIFKIVGDINTGFNLTDDSIADMAERFNNFNFEQNFGKDYEDFINSVRSNNADVADYFDSLAEKGAFAKANVEDVYTTILDGNTKGLKNAKRTMLMYNKVQKSGEENAKAFANATSRSNATLGNYLSNLQKGYQNQVDTYVHNESQVKLYATQCNSWVAFTKYKGG